MTMASYILGLCFFIIPAFSQSNGMDSSMDVPMNLAVGNMLPYIHFTPGDTVWFLGWVPSSAGAMVGTCIGLLLFSILERWLAACIGLAEEHWAERTSILVLDKSSNTSSLASSPKPPASSPSPTPRESKRQRFRLPPFVPELEVTRGALFGAHAFFRVFLMMVVMTFQLAFIASIVVGSGVGEALFGRFSLSSFEH